MRALIVIALVVLCAGVALADGVRVIVHPKNAIQRVSKQFVADAFLKKRSRWSNDSAIQPVDLGQKHAVRVRFTRDLLGRDVSAVRRYWAQLVFSGRGVPPPEISTEEDVIAYVAKNAGAIGYVSSSANVSAVKVLVIE